MKLILSKFFKSVFSFCCPRYSLKIDDTLQRNGETYYQIIAIGEQRPIVLSSQEILSSKKIKENLPPDDLISVVENSIKEKIRMSQYYLTETNRDNTYTLQNKNTSTLISGEEFCKNIALLEQTSPLDIYRIVSTFYFNVGRNLEKSNNAQFEKPSPTVVLSIVK